MVVRPYRAGDETAINEAFNQTFGVERPLAEWQWKLGGRERGGCTVIAEAADGRLVGHYAAVAVPFRYRGRDLSFGQIVDVFTRPEGRGGLAGVRTFRALVEEFTRRFAGPDGLAVVYGFPGVRHARLVRLGYGKLGEAEMPPRPAPYWRRQSGMRYGWWRRRGFCVRRGLDEQAYADLWRRAEARYPVGALRDAGWLRRRFADRPGSSYVYLAAQRAEEVHAHAVLRLEADRCRVADLVWSGRSARALMALDHAATGTARAAGCSAIDMWLGADREAEEVLAAAGWERQADPQSLEMFAYAFHPAVTPDILAREMYVTLADSDLV